MEPTKTRDAGASREPFGTKKAVSTPVGIEQIAAPGAFVASSSRSRSDTAIVRLAREHARASAQRIFRHSTSSSVRLQGRVSTRLRRFQMTCSTL